MSFKSSEDEGYVQVMCTTGYCTLNSIHSTGKLEDLLKEDRFNYNETLITEDGLYTLDGNTAFN